MEFAEGARGVIAGRVAEIRFRDERSGRTVAVISTDDGRQVAAVGVLADVAVDDEVALTGTVVADPRFGLQFAIEGVADPIADAETAYGYLAARLVPWIGPSTARLIVDALGAEALAVIARDPSVLQGFRGLTPARMPSVRRGLARTLRFAPAIGLLDPHGVSLAVSKRVMRRYGAAAQEVIRANPWRLAKEVGGIGFKTADKVARGLGRDPSAPERAEAAVLQALRDLAKSEGHTVADPPVAVATAAAMANLLPGDGEAALARLIASGEVLRSAGDTVGLPRLVYAEQSIAAKVRQIASFSDAEPIDLSDADIAAIGEAEGIVFDDSQRRAIRGAFSDRITVITGGPGTGKTTIVRAVLDVAERLHHMRCVLVSPTGRAAKRLSEATGRKASTIHRWMRYHPELGWQGPVGDLPDLLVCDEASMLDVAVTEKMLGALPPFVRLVLVGDIDQLPSVGPGNVLADLVASPQVSVFRLNVIHRTAEGSGIPMLAADINAGVRNPRFDGTTARLVERETVQECADYIAELLARYADRAEDIQVITPGYDGPIGVTSLNRRLAPIMNPVPEGAISERRGGYDLHEGDRILVTANDGDHGLYNGDTGYLRSIASDKTLDVDVGSESHILPPDAGTALALGLAISVHKAQGSEYPLVVIPMHHKMQSAFVLFERRLLYTAVSRAQRAVVVVGTRRAINWAISVHDPKSRRTTLRRLLAAAEAAPAPQIPVIGDDDLF
jgi:exodeoxyribonuclease V alpha subunit